MSWGWGTCPQLGVERPFPALPLLTLAGACELIQVKLQRGLGDPAGPTLPL